MNPYKEFQFSWLIFFCMVPTEILMIYLYVFQIGDHPMDAFIFLLISAIIGLSYTFFYGMTTMVDNQWIRISFGVGLIRKNIKIEGIAVINTVTNPWYYGWGIRFIPQGMLFNIRGWEAVELRFKGEQRIIRIGSKDPMKLRNEIESRLHS